VRTDESGPSGHNNAFHLKSPALRCYSGVERGVPRRLGGDATYPPPR
jgi:hypothetical protein